MLEHVPVQVGSLLSVPVVGVVGEPPEHAASSTAEIGSKLRHARICEVCLMIQRVRPQAPVWFRGPALIGS